MASPFFFSLESTHPQHSYAGGSLTSITSKEMPGLIGLSFANLKLASRGALRPIWHPNAHKVGFCKKGKVLVSIRTPSGAETFTVEKGEIFFIPQGNVHRVENMREEDSIIHFALSHASPETMYLTKAVYSISDTVFERTFETASGFVKKLKETEQEALITVLPTSKNQPDFIASRYKFNIEASHKAIDTAGGYVQLGIKNNLTLLQGLGILGFGLNLKGIVEPHWHTNAGELVYIVKGKTRITILSPEGQAEVLEVKGGEGAFAPASYFHNIENIGNEEVEVIAFFSHAEPDFIGIGEVMGSYSNDALASVFNVEANYFDEFKKPAGPLVIVPL